MFGYVTFNVKYHILSQIIYKKIGWLNQNKEIYWLEMFHQSLIWCVLHENEGSSNLFRITAGNGN